MAPFPPDSPLPAHGSLVGSWIVGRNIGSGSYGTVFRVVNSRIHHPSVPRFEGRGAWKGPDGEAYPYVVMQSVEGISLYAWALEHGLTSYAVVGYGWQGYYEPEPTDDLYSLGVTAYRLLAGDYPPSEPGAADGSQKVVRLEAPRKVNEVCPELGNLIERLLAEDPAARGSAQAMAEELEALLEYSRPALDEPWMTDASRQPTDQAAPPAPRKPTPPGDPPPPPVSREQAREESVPHQASVAPVEPALHQAPAMPVGPAPRQAPAAPVEPAPKLGHAGVFFLLAVVGVVGMLMTGDGDRSEVASTEPERKRHATGSPDAGPSGLGEEALASVTSAETPPAPDKKITREVPSKPLSDQKLPPCSERSAVVINGGCWRIQAPGADIAPCDSDLYEHRGRCYAPILISAERVPTSKDPQ